MPPAAAPVASPAATAVPSAVAAQRPNLGYYAFDRNGVETLYAPYMTAALVGAMASGLPAGTPLTNKALNVRGMELQIRNPTDTDALIDGGVLCVEDTDEGSKIVKSISTWVLNDKYNRVEISTGAALDLVAIELRKALDVLRGSRGDPKLLGRGFHIAEAKLKDLAVLPPNGPGVIVGDDASPAYRGLQLTLVGDAIRTYVEVSPVIPNNFIGIEIFATPFSGSISS